LAGQQAIETLIDMYKLRGLSCQWKLPSWDISLHRQCKTWFFRSNLTFI